MRGTMPPPHRIPPWRAQEKLYLYLIPVTCVAILVPKFPERRSLSDHFTLSTSLNYLNAAMNNSVRSFLTPVPCISIICNLLYELYYYIKVYIACFYMFRR